jgi:hypothetical protein
MIDYLRGGAAALGLAVTLMSGAAVAADAPPLTLERKIPLGDVRGRIDHLAVDPAHRRLFVAELGNDSVGVVDADGPKLLRRIGGLKEPQGVGYVSASDTLLVANAGDGSVRAFAGPDFTPAWRLDLGEDADNVRIDAAGEAIVGYGGGALAILDPRTRVKLADMPLKGHPESFQIAESGRIVVNVPEAHEIAVVDRTAGRQIATWPLVDVGANFPMAIDKAAHRVIVVARHPARLLAFAEDGARVGEIPTCGDADDVWVDAKRNRIYVSCGEGAVDIVARDDTRYHSIGRLPTASGARTSFFLSDTDRLYLAVRATQLEKAAIWVLRPPP